VVEIMSTLPHDVKSNTNKFWKYFTDKDFDRDKIKNIHYIYLKEIEDYYINNIKQ